MGRLPLFRSNGSVNFEWGSKRVSRTTLYPFCICVVRCLSDCPFAATSRTENITQFSRFSCFCSCITDSFLLSIHCAQHMLSAVFCSEAAKKLKQNASCIFIRGNKEDYWLNRRKDQNCDWKSGNRRFSSEFRADLSHRPPVESFRKSGKLFPHGKSGKFVEWKTKVCGKNRGKPDVLEIPLPQAVENTFHSFLPQIPQARFYSC